MFAIRHLLGLCGALAVLTATALPANAEKFVDLELVLAVDISMSMDIVEQRLQRDGYVAALRDPQVIKAIQSGPQGRIAITYVEWAGFRSHSVVVPWRIISNAQESLQLSNELAAQPIARARRTSISSAVTFAATLFGKDGLRGLRRVIDVSGDGPNNAGELIVPARDRVLRKGIIINGLAIQIQRSGYSPFSFFDIDNLDDYYRNCVIGGAGAFVLSIKRKVEFATAIRQKLLLEVAGRSPDPQQGPRLHRAQFKPQEPQRADCEIGEKRWQQFWQGQE
jgi:Protein of unknown function (DUF1194)